MGFLGSIGDALAGKLFGSDSRSLMENQQAFTEKQMRMKHQWEVEDLKKAGLNPILSALSAGSIGSSGSAASLGSGESDFSSALQLRKVNQEVKESKARERLYDAQAAKVGVGQPAYEKAAELLQGLINKFIPANNGNITTGFEASKDTVKELSVRAPSSSAKFPAVRPIDKIIEASTKKDSWLQKAMKWLAQGELAPIETVLPKDFPTKAKLLAGVKATEDYKKASPEKKAYMLHLAEEKAKEKGWK